MKKRGSDGKEYVKRERKERWIRMELIDGGGTFPP